MVIAAKTVKWDEIKHQNLIRRITLHALTELQLRYAIIITVRSVLLNACVYIERVWVASIHQPTDLVELVKRLIHGILLLHLMCIAIHTQMDDNDDDGTPFHHNFIVFLQRPFVAIIYSYKCMFSLSLNALKYTMNAVTRGKNYPSFLFMPVNSTVRVHSSLGEWTMRLCAVCCVCLFLSISIFRKQIWVE